MLCMSPITSTLMEGGSVLVAVDYSMQIIMDALEITAWMAEQTGSSGTVQIYCVGQSIKTGLHLAMSCAEWLLASRAENIYLSDSGNAFWFEALKSRNALKCFASFEEIGDSSLTHPCILFCAHSSLQMGPALHTVQLW
eukprot:Platyproteum_vivax@DN8722_c0_g1_i1.p2